ncbi:PE-PPE domain-containing protein (plasmid) [Mycobacterium sp. SMC-8]|uniref:PE-PPE domain-containing protein n=2 Tax=Bacillati TaxID=1783272 RepID=UPI0021B29717|nr:PE-PPE domain-containing protein [Mycobacterium sp. SMC-8]UXA15759.1 PE-PPE domain-containing protein [Mycobacterium sp. SMC-8]
MSTNVSRLAATVIAAATVTALTTAAAVAEPPAPPRLVDAQVNLAASTGLYPIGPIPQAFRSLGMGTAQDFMNGLAGLAQLIPGDAGQGLKRTVEDVAALLVALQTGINLPILGNIAIPEIAVPPLGPAGTIDQINTLQWSTATQATLSAVKTALAAGDAAAVIIGLLGDLTGIDTDILETLIGELPLNVPGAWDGPFFSDAGKLAIVPAIGLGGTNFALASPTLLNDPAFAKTAILAIAVRNPSRTGGGILSLLNPLSSTVGLNLSNADGTASHKSTNGFGIPITVMDGNVTVWDFGAAYDIISDAPSTLLNPLAWLNTGVGVVAPTYLLPPNVDAFFNVISDITGGSVGAGTINGLLDTLDVMSLLHVDVGADGNLYVTYDSGRLPLLEPIQFIPRTLSYLPGFGFSTTLSDSFADVLTQLVAQGYHDVTMTTDADGVATFTRGWDKAGTQAKFWQNPVSWQMGLETPQTVFNSVITGLQTNLLNPAKGEFTVFGNSEIGNLLYRNAVSVAVAQGLSQALEHVRDQLNPVMNDMQAALQPLARALDDVTAQLNRVVDDVLGAATDLGVDLNGPMLGTNRLVNQVGDGLNNGVRGLFGLKPITSPPALESTNDSSQQRATAISTTTVQSPAITDTPAANSTTITLETPPETTVPEPTATAERVSSPDPAEDAQRPAPTTNGNQIAGRTNETADDDEKPTTTSGSEESAAATPKPAAKQGSRDRQDRPDDEAGVSPGRSDAPSADRAGNTSNRIERRSDRGSNTPRGSVRPDGASDGSKTARSDATAAGDSRSEARGRSAPASSQD